MCCCNTSNISEVTRASVTFLSISYDKRFSSWPMTVCCITTQLLLLCFCSRSPRSPLVNARRGPYSHRALPTRTYRVRSCGCALLFDKIVKREPLQVCSFFFATPHLLLTPLLLPPRPPHTSHWWRRTCATPANDALRRMRQLRFYSSGLPAPRTGRAGRSRWRRRRQRSRPPLTTSPER